MNEDPGQEIRDEVRETFFGLLSQDVILSLERKRQNDNQASRRDLVRTMFAAIEGYAQEYRDHVRSIADDIEPIDPVMSLALSEKTYFISENGHVDVQIRYTPLPSMIRLVTRLASEICPQLKVDFSGSDWRNFRQAATIRNRITHPKSKSDLTISDDDIDVVQMAFFWLLTVITETMAATNEAASRHLAVLTEFGDRLLAGDNQALALYEAARLELD
jgi:hypothetical protein